MRSKERIPSLSLSLSLPALLSLFFVWSAESVSLSLLGREPVPSGCSWNGAENIMADGSGRYYSTVATTTIRREEESKRCASHFLPVELDSRTAEGAGGLSSSRRKYCNRTVARERERQTLSSYSTSLNTFAHHCLNPSCAGSRRACSLSCCSLRK